MLKRKDDWIAFGKQAKRHLFFFEDKVLDLTNFMGEHPGGKKALGNYVFKDVTDIIFSVYPHKRQPTIRKLNTFIIGKIPPTDTKSPKIERSPTPTKDNKEKKKVCFAKKNHQNSQKDVPKEQAHTASSVSKSTKQNSSEERKMTTSEKKQRSKVRTKSKQKSQKVLKPKEIKQLKEQTSEINSLKALSEDLDEEKPAFKVPILFVKHMNQLE